jgi:hypothetical protein
VIEIQKKKPDIFVTYVYKYINTQKKHANVINQQDFILLCKKRRIVPASLKFNLHLDTFKEEKFERILSIFELLFIIMERQCGLQNYKKRKYRETMLSI